MLRSKIACRSRIDGLFQAQPTHTDLETHFLIAAITEIAEFLEDSFTFRTRSNRRHLHTSSMQHQSRYEVLEMHDWPRAVARFYSLLNLCFNGVMATSVHTSVKPTQFSQGIFKPVHALPHSLPLVGHMSSNCVVTCLLFITNILTLSELNFFM